MTNKDIPIETSFVASCFVLFVLICLIILMDTKPRPYPCTKNASDISINFNDRIKVQRQRFYWEIYALHEKSRDKKTTATLF